MALLVLWDELEPTQSAKVTLDIFKQCGGLVVILNRPENFLATVEALGGKLKIDKIAVLAFAPPTVAQWEKFLQDRNFYEHDVPIKWLTPLH